jgi:hypothetical protein
MAYLTYQEFLTYNTGVTMTQDEFAVLYFYAETSIDSYLGRHLWEIDDYFRKAVAMQVALSKQNGGAAYYADNSSTTQITSESVPDYSYSVGMKTNTGYNAVKDVYGIFPIVATMLSKYYIKAVEVDL